MTTILSFTVIILTLILGGLIFYILKNLKNKNFISCIKSINTFNLTFRNLIEGSINGRQF